MFEPAARIRIAKAEPKRSLDRGMVLQIGVLGMRICEAAACVYLSAFLRASFSVTTKSLRVSKFEIVCVEDIHPSCSA